MTPRCSRFCSAFILIGTLQVLNLFAADAKTQPSKSSPVAVTKILAIRVTLDEAFPRDPDSLSSKELAAAKEKIIKGSEELSAAANKFLEEFPASDYLVDIARQEIYATVLLGMLRNKDSLKLGDLSDSIPSCLFVSETSQALSIPAQKASALQAAAESSFADAVITGLKLKPESYNGIVQFLHRSNTKSGRRLAQALLNDPRVSDSLRSCAGFILNRKFGVGDAPDLRFTAIDEREVDLKSLRGKVVLLDFWGTYCAPCMSQLPELKSLHHRYRNQGFEILGIALDKERTTVEKAVQEEKIPWPNFASKEGATNELAIAFGIYAPPNYWLVDRKGSVREIMVDSNLEEKIKFLLAESP